MEMTIKQLADELGVSKTTISKVVSGLGFNGKLHKVGNRYMLSETQISQIKSQISQFSQTDEEEKSQRTQTSQTDEKEKIQISLLEKQNAILQEQLTEYSTIEQSSDETEQPKQKQGLFSRLFGRKDNI